MLISGGVGFSATKDATVGVQLSEQQGDIYKQMQLAAVGLTQDIFDKAYAGWQKMQGPNRLLSIADFSQSSNVKRLYIIDVKNQKLLFQTYVAHGRNSGEEFAASFSNVAESYKSSRGILYDGAKLYKNGKHGRIHQHTERDRNRVWNDMAEGRAIVASWCGLRERKPSSGNTEGWGEARGCPC
jgi:hypothetical protein